MKFLPGELIMPYGRYRTGTQLKVVKGFITLFHGFRISSGCPSVCLLDRRFSVPNLVRYLHSLKKRYGTYQEGTVGTVR